MPWLRWLLSAFAFAFPVLLVAYLIRDRPLSVAVSQALVWGGISAWVFTIAQIRRYRRGQRCAVCEVVAGKD